MKNTRLSKELAELITHKGDLCISLIIPMQGLPASSPVNLTAIRHTLSKLRSRLEEMNYQKSVLLEKAEQLAEQAGAITGVGGIGIFVSHELARLCTFPFEVKERLVVDNSFELRDLVQKQRYTQEYMLLLLGGHGSRLFRGREKWLTEVNDQNFPTSFDGLDYEVPVQLNQGNNANKAWKRDAATTTQSAEAYLNLLDEKLRAYLNPNVILVVAGPDKELSHYLNHSAHTSVIRDTIQGSFDDATIGQLNEKTWDAMQLYLKKEEHELLLRLAEMGREFVSAGIQDVWYDAYQGKGNILLVERDLELPAYVSNDGSQLQLSPTGGAQKQVSDAVDDVVETVLEKNGTVVFVNNGLLQNYNGIAMINRY